MSNISTYTYIKFDRGYNFDIIPEGFTYETADEEYKKHQDFIKNISEIKKEDIVYGDYICRRITLLDEKGNRRPREDVDKEIKKVNKILLNWSKLLKPIKK